MFSCNGTAKGLLVLDLDGEECDAQVDQSNRRRA
jgi:hypothetical protein